jgi:PAS domain S-box-containing protein
MGAGEEGELSIVQSIINGLPGAVAYLSSDELVVRYASEDHLFFLPKMFRDRDVTGLKLKDIIYDNERGSLLPLLGRASETKESVDIKDVQIVNEEGERFWVELHASPIENGTPQADLLVTLRDVTGRKMAEEALQRSEQMLNIVIDNFPGVVYWKDRDSVYLGANKEAARIAGLADPSEYMGKDDYDLPWSRTEAEAYRADDRQVMESGRPKLHVIESQRRADGSLGWLDTCKVPLYDSQGKVVGVLGTSMDITERKRTEDELRCDEARNRALFELAQSPGATSKDISGRAMEIGIELTKSKIGYITFMSEDETILTVRNYS